MTFYSVDVSTAGINPGSATTAAFFDINVMLASRLQYAATAVAVSVEVIFNPLRLFLRF